MDSYFIGSTKKYNIILYNNNRVLQITPEGYLQMVLDESKATQMELQEYVNCNCMRRSLSLYYNNNPIHFKYPKKNENVKIDLSDTSCKPYILEKKDNHITHFAILNNSFALWGLDDYNRLDNIDGPIKWYELNTTNNGLKTPKPNQLFSVKYL
jgi:hypothetical protein